MRAISISVPAEPQPTEAVKHAINVLADGVLLGVVELQADVPQSLGPYLADGDFEIRVTNEDAAGNRWPSAVVATISSDEASTPVDLSTVVDNPPAEAPQEPAPIEPVAEQPAEVVTDAVETAPETDAVG
jgi:hypothetical protein